MKLSRKDLTKAVARYARKHGYYVSTVRNMTRLRYDAIKEWRNR
jgi:hypothetical protein